MLRSLELSHIGPADQMRFEPRPGLNIIAGDNGLGKSFLLDLAWWSVTRTWAGRDILPSLDRPGPASVKVVFDAASGPARLTVRYDRQERTWTFPKGQPGQPGLVVYARVDGDFAVWDSSRRFRDFHESEVGVPKGLVFDRSSVWDGLKVNERPICNGLLADWTTWQQTASPEFEQLRAALKVLSPSPSEPLTPGRPARIDPNDSRLIPTLRTPYGEQVPVTVASAGVRRILALAYMLVWAWREHLELARLGGRTPTPRVLLLVDEVELHLHPKWQRAILPAIVDTLSLLTRPVAGSPPPQIQSIVSTHSPLVLASVEPVFDEARDGLFELELEGNPQFGPQSVVLRNPDFRRHGDASSWLVSDLFGLDSSRSLQAQETIARAGALMATGDPGPADVAHMQAELAAVLSDIDPFWIRWRAVVEAEPDDAPQDTRSPSGSQGFAAS